MENIKKAQQADAQVNRVLSGIELQQLNQRTSVDTTGYFKRDGILYHTEPATIENKQAITQLVIPASMKEEILTFYHDSPFGGGHGGILRTYNKIKVRYYWNDLHKDVINYVGRCIKCTERKNRHWSFTVPGMARNPALYPMHTIAIDYVGPLPLSGTEKFKYVMVIVDQHSRFTICVPVKNKSAATAAQVLIREVFTKYGFPENVLSDNDAAYVADLTKCIFCGLCEESCPVDSIVETRIFDYHGEQRGDLLYTKEMLLAIGDKFEAQIAADRAQDKNYR